MRGENINIADVANLFYLEKVPPYNRADEIHVVCPFCGDRRGKMSLRITKGGKEANVYNCFHCGAHGGITDFYMRLSGKTYAGVNANKDAYRDMVADITGDTSIKDRHEQWKKKLESLPKEHVKAEPEILDHTYRHLFSMLSLSEEHRKDLKKRGMSDEAIEKFLIKSMPYKTTGLCKALIEAGCRLKGVPGFYKYKDRWQMVRRKGYLCPVWDELNDHIVGAQIRLDDPKNGQKYVWLSSSGKDSGTSSGAPACLILGDHNPERVLVTEGILKAMVYHDLCPKGKKDTVIGVAGVANVRSLDRYLETGRFTEAIEAYDMDKFMPIDCDHDDKHCDACSKDYDICPYKQDKVKKIRQATESLSAELRGYGIEKIKHRFWDRNEACCWNGNIKGIDDFMLSLKKQHSSF